MYGLATRFVIIIAFCQFGPALGTEDRCHIDCRSPDRPHHTRPWHAIDPLRIELHLTRPYPYHLAADDESDHSFSSFCELGCTYFFATTSGTDEMVGEGRTTLDKCLNLCDERYSYDSSTPPYNDLAEMARLECRDGCLMALRRCQPGYYCSQLVFVDDRATENDSSGNFASREGGNMIPCPAGMYRNIDHDVVAECTPCPPNHYREDVGGRSLSDCSQCPAGTSAASLGSASVKNCVRCPAGTFSTRASSCMCITPRACAEGDAEKRDTVPYIGRW
jgi:hypothetical protein